jgi:hypothetical protein
MGYNFVAVEREQMLMPPSVADWLPEDHVAWFVLDVVAELDLSGFLSGYRAAGLGGAAYDPAMMLAVLIYAYCTGERSSRRDRAPVGRGRGVPGDGGQPAARPRHDRPVPLRSRRCSDRSSRSAPSRVAAARLVAIDGTRMVANASKEANRTAEQVAQEILADAAATDASEDAKESGGGSGGAGSDAGVGPRAGRRARLRRVLEELKAEAESIPTSR